MTTRLTFEADQLVGSAEIVRQIAERMETERYVSEEDEPLYMADLMRLEHHMQTVAYLFRFRLAAFSRHRKGGSNGVL